MAMQLKEIVDRLNGDPFNMELSIVGLDEKEPFELMEILQQVLIYLDSKHNVDLREEPSQAMYTRISDFLIILGYQSSFDPDFQQGLVTGDKSVVHPILYWALNNLEALKNRAYLAKYCMNLDVPDEYLSIDQVNDLWQTYKELQGQFKATHATVENERKSRMNPTDLQREVTQLDSEREQLSQKIVRLRENSAKDDNFQVLLHFTSMLRKEQEEEARLVEKLGEQRYQLEQSEQAYIELSARLREMREAQDANQGEGSAEAMLKMARQEARKNTEALSRVDKEKEEKILRLQEVEFALSDPQVVTKRDIENQEGAISSMQAEIQDLERKVNEHNQDSRLQVYKQQANLVAKKKELVFNEQKKNEEDKSSLREELSQKEKEYMDLKGHKFMKKEEFKNYAASLRDKSKKFKEMKAELTDLRHEVAVLVRTEQILEDKDPTPPGMRESEGELEKVSVQKSQVDKDKAKTLDEVSVIVEKINTKLKEKKNKLAPQIKALRSVRQKFQQVEVKYMEKKQIYDEAKSQIAADIKKATNEVQELEAEVMKEEQAYHELNMLLVSADTELARAHRETRCHRKADRHSEQFNTLSEQYTSEIARLDTLLNELRKQQKVVKSTQDGNLKQKKAFTQLQTLMAIKLQVARQESQGHLDPRYGMPHGAVMDASNTGVERLVIGD